MIFGLLLFLAICLSAFFLLLALVGTKVTAWITAILAALGVALIVYAYTAEKYQTADAYDAVGPAVCGVLLFISALIWAVVLALRWPIGG